MKNKFKENYKLFLKTEYWSSVKKLVLERDNKICRYCGATKFLQVHHLSYDHHFDEMNNLQDLITICKDCHKKQHGIVTKKKKKRTKIKQRPDDSVFEILSKKRPNRKMKNRNKITKGKNFKN